MVWWGGVLSKGGSGVPYWFPIYSFVIMFRSTRLPSESFVTLGVVGFQFPFSEIYCPVRSCHFSYLLSRTCLIIRFLLGFLTCLLQKLNVRIIYKILQPMQNREYSYIMFIRYLIFKCIFYHLKHGKDLLFLMLSSYKLQCNCPSMTFYWIIIFPYILICLTVE